MFNTWLCKHDVSACVPSERLFPAAEDRAFWEAAVPKAYVQQAEAYLGYVWPPVRATQYMAFWREHDRMAQETPHFARRQALVTLFLGELAENKGRFLADLTDGIFAVCEETFWGVSAHYAISHAGEVLPPAHDIYIDLFAAETAELLAVIYHVLHDRLQDFCPPLIKRIEYELERRIVQPYLHNTTDFWWMGYGGGLVNNWLPWILQNILTVSVILPMDLAVWEQVLRKSMTEIQRYYDSLPNDGGCDEGTVYWTKAGAMLFAYCEVLYRASGGRMDFFADEKLKRIGMYIAHAYIHGCRFVNFADGAGILQDSVVLYAAYGFGMRTGAQELCRLAGTLARCQDQNNQTVRGYSLKQILWSMIYQTEICSQPPFEAPPFAVLPDLQNVFYRKGSWYLAAKGGHNAESHNHNDVGSAIVFFDHAPILVDPGVGTYTGLNFSDKRYTLPCTQSAYHNLPLINGVMQHEGRQFAANRFTADEAQVTIGFGDAYPPEAQVSEAVRTIHVQESGITLVDRFVFEGDANCVCEQFMTPLDVKIEGDAAILGGKFRLCTAGATVTCDRLDANGDSRLIVAWGTDHLTRVKFTCYTDTAYVTLTTL